MIAERIEPCILLHQLLITEQLQSLYLEKMPLKSMKILKVGHIYRCTLVGLQYNSQIQFHLKAWCF